MSYSAPRRKRNWWEELANTVGRAADRVIPGDQSNWHNRGNTQTPTVRNEPQQQERSVRTRISEVLDTPKNNLQSMFSQKSQDTSSLDEANKRIQQNKNAYGVLGTPEGRANYFRQQNIPAVSQANDEIKGPWNQAALTEQRNRIAALERKKSRADALKIFDANTSQDRINRIKAGQAELYREQQRQQGRVGRDGVADQVLGAIPRVINTVKGGAGAAYGLALTGKDYAQGKDWQKRLAGVEETIEKDFDPTAGMGGRGTAFMNAKHATEISLADLAKSSVGYGAELYSLKFGGAPFQVMKQVGTQGGKVISKKGAEKLLPEVLKTSASGALGAGGFEALDNTNATLGSIGMAGTAGAVVAPVASIGMGYAGNQAGKLLTKAAPTAQKVSAAIDSGNILQKMTDNRIMAEGRLSVTSQKRDAAVAAGRSTKGLDIQHKKDVKAYWEAVAAEKAAQKNKDGGAGMSMKAVDDTPKPKSAVESLKQEARKYQDIADKQGGLTELQAGEYVKVKQQIRSIGYDNRKPIDKNKIATPLEANRTFSSETVATAYDDITRNKTIAMAIGDAVDGVYYDKNTPVDDILLGKNPDIAPQDFYNNFNGTREALRKEFGDTITLYRASGKQINKPTTNWATTESFAKQFGDDVVKKEVPIEDVVALNVTRNGKYHEVIVRESQPPKLTPKPNTTIKVVKGKTQKLDELMPDYKNRTPEQVTPLHEKYGVKKDTADRLVRDYGAERAEGALHYMDQAAGAGTVRTRDGFSIAQAEVMFGKVNPPKGKVRVTSGAPTEKMSPEEWASLQRSAPVQQTDLQAPKVDTSTPQAKVSPTSKIDPEILEVQNAVKQAQSEGKMQYARDLNDTLPPDNQVKLKPIEPNTKGDGATLKDGNVVSKEGITQNQVLREEQLARLNENDQIVSVLKAKSKSTDEYYKSLRILNGTDDTLKVAQPDAPKNVKVDTLPKAETPPKATETPPKATETPPKAETPVKLVDTSNGKVNPETGEIMSEPSKLGEITKNFFTKKKTDEKILFKDVEELGKNVSREINKAFEDAGSDFQKVARKVQESYEGGTRWLDDVDLSAKEKALWRKVQSEMDYVRERAGLSGREMGEGDLGEMYFPRQKEGTYGTRASLIEGFKDKKPGNEISRRTDEFALQLDEITYSADVVGNYITRYSDTKLLQTERVSRALTKSVPDAKADKIAQATKAIIDLQGRVNELKVKIGLGGLGRRKTVVDGKKIDFAGEMSEIGKNLGRSQTKVDGTPKGLTNGDKINSVTLNDGGKVKTIGDFLGLNQHRDSGAFAGAQVAEAKGNRNTLADLVGKRLKEVSDLPADDIKYMTDSIRNTRPNADESIVISRVVGIYRAAAKQQMLDNLQKVDMTNKTLRSSVSDLVNQIVREGSVEHELSSKIVSKTLRATNALFRKLNLSSALNELSDMTSFVNIYGKETKIFTPDFKLVKALGLGDVDPAIAPFMKQIEQGKPLKSVLKQINDGTKFYKFVETYKAGVVAKTAKEFYSQPKNGGLSGDALTAKILEDYRRLVLPVDAFTKTFLDNAPLYTQYMTWGARNLQKEGRLLTGQIDSGVMKDKSNAARMARNAYANLPAKTVFWLASNGLKGTAIMTAFGLTDFTGLTNQDYSGIQEEDKNAYDKTTQFTNISTVGSLLNTSIQHYEKERLKNSDKYKDADYNPYEHNDMKDSLINVYTPQFVKNARGAKNLKDDGFSENKAGRVQYEAPEDSFNQFKSFLFGKNQTENAREYSGNKSIAGRVKDGQNPASAMLDMAKEDLGIQDSKYKKPLNDDYSKEYKSAQKDGRAALLKGGRAFNGYLQDLERDKPEVYSRYIESMDGNHVKPEYWRNISHSDKGGTDLSIFKMIGDRKRQLSKDLKKPYDPVYDLPNEQASAYLQYRSAATGDNLALRSILNKEQWYKDLKERRAEFFDKNPVEDKEFKGTERVKKWEALDDRLSSFYYDADRAKEEGDPVWARQYPIVYQQKVINEKHGFDSDESKAFFKANGDSYREEKEKFDKAQLAIINQMRDIENYPEMSWAAYQQATKFANTDEDDKKKKAGGGSKGKTKGGTVSPYAGGRYATNPSTRIKITQPKTSTVKIKKRAPSKITIKRGGRI